MKEIKVGLIGFGFIGKLHAQAYRSIPYAFNPPAVLPRVAAVLRSHAGVKEGFLHSLGDPLVTTDVDTFFEALSGDGPAAVDICTPNDTHLLYAREALRRGLPVYCEKPMARSLPEAQEMEAAARAAGDGEVTTQVAFMLRYLPAVRQVKALLENGALGEVFHFRAKMFHGSYLDPERPMSWRLSRERSGGGALADLGSHLVDLLGYFLGEVSWVRAEMRTFIKDRPARAGTSKRLPVDVDDWASLTLGFECGATGTLEATRMAAGAHDDTTIALYGSRGSAYVDTHRPDAARYYDLRKQQWTEGVRGLPMASGERPIEQLWPPSKQSQGMMVDAHLACAYDFLQYAVEGKESPLSFASALKTQEVLAAAYRSARGEERRIEKG